MTRRQVAIDPAVAAILGEAEERQEQRRMGPGKRKTAKRAARRKAVTWELDRGVVGIVQEVAGALGISPAGVVNRLLVDGLERLAAGEVDFEGCLVPSRSPQYLWVVEVGVNGLGEAVRRRLDIRD